MSNQCVPVDADELERLRQNDARYRFLRIAGGSGFALINDWDMDDKEPEELDAAIDFAMARQQRRKNP